MKCLLDHLLPLLLVTSSNQFLSTFFLSEIDFVELSLPNSLPKCFGLLNQGIVTCFVCIYCECQVIGAFGIVQALYIVPHPSID